jgi:hypothetical protein
MWGMAKEEKRGEEEVPEPPRPPLPPKQKPGEIGGPKGPEPTRYGDWEVGGRCTDF